jgi:hypothetical protein
MFLIVQRYRTERRLRLPVRWELLMLGFAKSGKMLAAFSKIDPATIARMTRATYASRLDVALVQPIVNIAAQFEMIPAAFPASQLVAPVTG